MMGLFSRADSSRHRERSPKRRIPDLNPAYFEEVQRSIHAYGGTDSLIDIANGVANAIENVSRQLFAGWNEEWGAKSFDRAFANRDPSRPETADEMIDWMTEYEVTSQDVLETTLARLKEVLAKPPAA
jgi:hypothetical protein